MKVVEAELEDIQQKYLPAEVAHPPAKASSSPSSPSSTPSSPIGDDLLNAMDALTVKGSSTL